MAVSLDGMLVGSLDGTLVGSVDGGSGWTLVDGDESTILRLIELDGGDVEYALTDVLLRCQ